MFGGNGLQSFHEDMIRVERRLPAIHEYRRVRHLILDAHTEGMSDDQLADILPYLSHLETVDLTGVQPSDRSLVLLAAAAIDLQGINLSGCKTVTDVGILELATKSLPLQWIQLNGVTSCTDASISALAKTCPRLIEMELCRLPLLSPLSVRDIWSFSRKLRTLRLSGCNLLSDKAFPSGFLYDEDADENGEKPLPHRPVTWLDQLPPLILHHVADNLRVLDISYCKITDGAVEGIVRHAPRIQNLNLSGCSLLTDRALAHISRLRENLDVLLLAHVSNITDRAIVQLARACPNLRCVDVAFCRNLTDMSIFELSGLASLSRLSVIRVHRLTDLGMFSLAEHAKSMEHLYISYCDTISLDAIHLLLKKLSGLHHLAATGISSMKRIGVHRFSEHPPPDYTAEQQAVYRVFNGPGIEALRKFLDKEEQRQREAELRNIPFSPRSDDKMDLY